MNWQARLAGSVENDPNRTFVALAYSAGRTMVNLCEHDVEALQGANGGRSRLAASQVGAIDQALGALAAC
jgi:hypothetical protein